MCMRLALCSMQQRFTKLQVKSKNTHLITVKYLLFLTVDTQLLKLRLFVLVFLHGREEFFIVICFNLFFFYTVAKKSNFENISKPIAPDAV